MMHNEQKQLVRRHMLERWMSSEHTAENDCDGGRSATLTAPKSDIESLSIEQFIFYIRMACPDMTMIINDLVAEGSRVVARWTLQGTDTQGYRGRLPTGGQIVVTGIQFIRFEQDRLIDELEIVDRVEPLSQLGFVCLPKPPTVTLRRPSTASGY
jgi:predicted ester cyclase